MPTTIITTDDLREFKIELLNDFKQILQETYNQTEQKQWLRSSEVRKLLNVSPGTLQNLRISGKLSFTKIGHLMYYSYPEIEKLITEN